MYHNNKDNQDGFKPSAFDRTVYSLCDQIDSLELQVEYWKSKYEEVNKEYLEAQKSHHASIMDGVGQALALAFNMQEDGQGNLVINPEGRANILEHLNTEQI